MGLWSLVFGLWSLAPAGAGPAASPLLTGGRILVETDLPHLPPDAKVTVAWLGRPKAVFPARVGKGTVDISRFPPGEYTLTVEAKDPQSPGRSLYYRSIEVRKEDAADLPTAVTDARLLVACDGAAWAAADEGVNGGRGEGVKAGERPGVARPLSGSVGDTGSRAPGVPGAGGSEPPPSISVHPRSFAAPLWDHLGTVKAALVGKWPAGEVRARAEVVARDLDDRERGHVRVWPGETRLQIVVTLQNPTKVAQRVLASGLRLSLAGRDETERFFIVPLASLPAAIPPGGRAEQVFRADTFDDTPTGDYRIEPLALCAPAEADLLADGAFEDAAALGPPNSPTLGGVGGRAASGWSLPANAPEGFRAETVKAGASYSELGMLLADWSDYTKLSFANDRRIAAQGKSLLEATFAAAPSQPRVVAQQVAALGPPNPPTLGGFGGPGGARYLVGISSWAGSRVVLEWLNAAGLPVGEQERCFSGVWWHEQVAAWRARLFGVSAPAGAVAARLSLVASEKTSWWDDAFLVPESAVRGASTMPARLTLAGNRPVTPSPRHPVIRYLGEDRETKGNWIGNYGQYAWILCGMSAPRDMVGGTAKPLKCHHDDLSKTYANETIWVRGKDELRYTAWTGNPKDVLVRHWIGVHRTEDIRALENPQWGERTWACWDDHGELHPTDGWGPDLYVKLRMPPGSWRVGLYFVDWDWAGTPFPRAHRLAFLQDGGREACRARVAGIKGGAYKLFAVQGGGDTVLRLRKDASIAVTLAGIFIDAITGGSIAGGQRATAARAIAAGHQRPTEGTALRLAHVTDRRATLVKDGPPRAVPASELREHWRMLCDLGSTPRRRNEAFAEYANALAAEVGEVAAGMQMAALGHRALAQGDWGTAEQAYDQALRRRHDGPSAMADSCAWLALRFAAVHPLYAHRKLATACAALRRLPDTRRLSAVRALARRVFDRALDEHTRSRGLVRTPMSLALSSLRAVEEDAGYAALTRSERGRLLAAAERATWYNTGWLDVAAESTRFWGSLTPAQRRWLGPGFFGDHCVRAYASLAATDAAYQDRMAELVDLFRDTLDPVSLGFARHAQAEAAYRRGHREGAELICREVMDAVPGTRPAALCAALLDVIVRSEGRGG